MLADIAVHDLAAFGTLAEAAGKALNIEVKKPETLPRYVVEPRPAKGKAAAKAEPEAEGGEEAAVAKKAPAKKAPAKKATATKATAVKKPAVKKAAPKKAAAAAE